MSLLDIFKRNSLLIDPKTGIASKKAIKKFTAKPDFPYLISFPRTGSHWLRMLMELYFDKPSLALAFYLKDANDFTCYHRHDEELEVKDIRNVIYLYRHPVDTIYSQMNYYNEDLKDKNRILYWSNSYGRHLQKWLFDESFTQKKVVLTYEGLKNNLDVEFEKICAFLELNFDAEKLSIVNKEVSKQKLKDKTKHDTQVVNLSNSYQDNREKFRTNSASLILNNMEKIDIRFNKLFSTND